MWRMGIFDTIYVMYTFMLYLLYISVKCCSENTLESDDKTPDGKPMLSLEQQNGDYILSAWTFGKLETVLKQAGEKKMAETRACLEGKVAVIIMIIDLSQTLKKKLSLVIRLLQDRN